jgi:transcriptional regulator CtsR
LALERFEQADTYEIAALARSKGDGTLIRIRLKVDEKPPHGIDALVYEIDPDITATLMKPSKGKMTEAQILTSLETYLNERVAADRFSGAVLIAKDGKPSLRQSLRIGE